VAKILSRSDSSGLWARWAAAERRTCSTGELIGLFTTESEGRRGVWSHSSCGWAWGGVEGAGRVSEFGWVRSRWWSCASSRPWSDPDRVTGGPGVALSTAEGRLDMERTLVKPGWNGVSIWPWRECFSGYAADLLAFGGCLARDRSVFDYE
jgi:hypothetical protein